MKVRTGFVSNSSSSSFLIIGREMDVTKVTSRMIKEKQIVALGDDLSDGQEVFQITNVEELAFLKALNKLDSEHSFSIVDACVFGDGEYEGEIDVRNLPKSGKVQYFVGMRDDHSSGNIEDLKNRYDERGEVSRIMQRYLRGKKINKIEKASQC